MPALRSGAAAAAAPTAAVSGSGEGGERSRTVYSAAPEWHGVTHITQYVDSRTVLLKYGVCTLRRVPISFFTMQSTYIDCMSCVPKKGKIAGSINPAVVVYFRTLALCNLSRTHACSAQILSPHKNTHSRLSGYVCPLRYVDTVVPPAPERVRKKIFGTNTTANTLA